MQQLKLYFFFQIFEVSFGNSLNTILTEQATEISSTIIKTSSCKHKKAISPIFLSQLEAANSNVSGTGFVKLNRLSGPGISHSYNELLFVLIEISCNSYKSYKHPSAGRH